MDWTRLPRWSRVHPFAVDLVVVVVLAAIVVPWSTGVNQVGEEVREPIWALLLVAPLAWRRTHPVASAVAVFAVGAVQLLVGPWLVLPADLLVLVSLYSVTVHGPRWAGRTAMASVLVGVGVFLGRGALTMDYPASLDETLFLACLMGVMGLAVWAFALLRRSRRETLAALHDRADRLERERDQQHQLAAAAERARIAREMHDVVAHSLSVVIAQADGGRYAATGDPDAAIRALSTIGDTGRTALADMRRILGVLRADPESDRTAIASHAPAVSPASGVSDLRLELAPQPTADDLETLLEQMRTVGVEVSSVEVGEARPLPVGMSLTIHRICQEALTNVLKHAGPKPNVTLLRRWGPSTLVLDIADDGRGAAADDDGDGHGLLGMRERVALFDGSFSAGPRRGGGFEVRVELPLPADGAAAITSDEEQTT